MELVLSSRLGPVPAGSVFHWLPAASCGMKHVAPLSLIVVATQSGGPCSPEGYPWRARVRATSGLNHVDHPGRGLLDTMLVLRSLPSSGL